jgi:hypothetical protein
MKHWRDLEFSAYGRKFKPPVQQAVIDSGSGPADLLYGAAFCGPAAEEGAMKDKKTIKRDILDKFREIEAEDNDQLPLPWLERDYLNELKAAEKKLFKKAIQELITAGILESVEGPSLNLRLTRKGENLIYAGGLHRPSREEGSGSFSFHFTDTEA